jgi:murein DD-endopeptidase MepM/ murein hydrolase activator NlpD
VAAEAAAAIKPALPREKPTVTIEPVAPQVEQELDTAAAEEPAAEAVWQEEEESLPLYFIWPVSGVLERGHSQEVLLYDRTMADWRRHNGWDIAAELGTQVAAVADGVVSRVYSDDLYGTVVEIQHPNGLRSVYANLAAVPTVVIGQQVSGGDILGAVGDTALGEIGEVCHLHFAMEDDTGAVDPALWLPMN